MYSPKKRAYRGNRHRITSASLYLHWKIFMFAIMESRVLAVLLSTFLVVAFITEKAAGFTAPRCPPVCKKNKENYREVDLLP